VLGDSNAFASFAVGDLAAAKDFYANTLGIEVKEPPEMGGILELQVAGGPPVVVYPKPDHVPATFTVLNFAVGDIETAVDALAERGVRFERYDDPAIKTDDKGIARGGPGPSIAWFKDPSGNILSVLET
jgi:predicted enzyme related to lactoylglutathione lyase